MLTWFVLRGRQERRLGRAASVLAGARVAVRCQSLGGAFVDGGPELGYVRWRPDGRPEPAATWPTPRGLRRSTPHSSAAPSRPWSAP